VSEEGRIYGGRTAEQRRAGRRARLEAACLQVVGTQGWAQTSVQGVCEVAGVATRTLYEEHGTLANLLRVTYADLLATALAEVTSALDAAGASGPAGDRVRVGLAAYVGWMTDDPRRARVCHREVRVSGVLDEERRRGVAGFAELVAAQSGASPVRSLALTGAVNEVLVQWVADGCDGAVVPGLVSELAEVLRLVLLAGT
jgi:AcrR family transcriptional regulator